MNRRDFMRGVAAGLSVTQVPNLLLAAEADAGSPRAWLKDSPFVAVGSWDDMPIFQLRTGGAPIWQEADYQREHSEETVSKLKNLGVTVAIIDFFKGFGLEAEKEHIDLARKLTALFHKYDVRVGLYVGSTIAYETFLLEEPEAEQWFVPDYLGKPVIYGDQTFRKRVYFMHPGYVEYIKGVVRLGVKSLQADMIHFDNTSLQARPEIFQHPLAIQDFRDYLQSNYSAEELKKRMGFSNVKYVLPPKLERPLRLIDDPMFQLWTDFRCHQLNRYYAEMKQLIRGLNPAVVIDNNPASGMSGANTIWDQGVNYSGLYPHLDISWTEEGDDAAVTEDGILVSKIRTYKMGSLLDTQILTYTASSGHYGAGEGGKLAMAESMAFNRQSLGMVGGLLDALELPADERDYINFYHENFEYYRDVENVADVGVLYSYATMGFNNDRPAVSFMLATQTLIQAKVPFDIIFDENLKNLSKYRVLLLADQECLDDEQLELIRKYVERGGGLVASEQTSLYTRARRRRPDFGLKDLFRVKAPAWRGAGRDEEDLKIAPAHNQVQQGRVSYLAAIKPAIAKPPTATMSSQYWKLPLNWTELIAAVRWAAGDSLSLEVKPLQTLNVVAELMDQKQKDRRLVHLLNYAARQGLTINNLEVNVEAPNGKQTRQVILLTPEGNKKERVACKVEGGRARFSVPHLETYALAVLEFEA
ncbi:MAG: hypothetical protein M1423_07820 [Acidobacteria bacterium]|nr:hypothetical protein [Acidobacteriota bacterium]